MLKLGVIEPATAEPGLLCPVFGVPKSDGTTRFVHDLRVLNEVLPPQRFRMESLASLRTFLLPGDWLCKVDLSKAYWHVGIAPECRKWLRFADPGGKVWQMTAMSFGLARAPRVFTKLLRPVIAALRASSVRVLAYLDDFLVAAQDKATAEAAADKVVATLRGLGFVVNEAKWELVAARQRTFLGVVVDTELGLLTAVPAKLAAVTDTARRMARRAAAERLPTVLDLQRLLGSLRFLTWCVAEAKARQVHLMTCLRLAQRRTRGQQLRRPCVKLSQQALAELEWWGEQVSPAGITLMPPPRRATIEVDATDTTAGFSWRVGDVAATRSMPLPVDAIGRSSAQRELAAMELALQSLLSSGALSAVQRPATVLVRTDSRAAMGCARRVYSGVPAMMKIARRVTLAARAAEVELEVEYVPGVDNVLADGLSRYHTSALNESAVATWVPEWCAKQLRTAAPTLDVFASSRNAVLPEFLTWRQQPGAAGQDAFSVPKWSRAVWMFPPPPLAMAAMREVTRRSEVSLALLVVPEWTAQPFWPHAQLLSRGLSVRLPPGAVAVPATARVSPRSWCCFALSKPLAQA